MAAARIGLTSRKRQHGLFSLVGIMFALVILGLLLPTINGWLTESRLRTKADASGALLAQYTGALRAFLSDRGDTAIVDAGCTVGTLCAMTGTDWLKNSADCAVATGTLTQSYLPCNFPNVIYGRALTTHLFVNAGNNHAVVRMDGWVDRQQAPRPDLSTRAAVNANASTAGMGVQTVSGGGPDYAALNPLAGAFYSYYVYETGDAWNYDAGTEAPAPTDNQIVAESNSAPSLDAWLRTDGSNHMNADLDMDGHDIINVNNIDANSASFAGDVTANDFIVNALGGQRVSSFWSNSIVVTAAGVDVAQPTCPAGSVADGDFAVRKIVYYPAGSPGVPGSQIGDISAQAEYLMVPGPGLWRPMVEITSTNAPDPTVPVLLNPTNSDVVGVILTRCLPT
ncbi:hypothetical protein E4T66_18000 [Sinimarinibacterium sp. CAU 1509]|uniref:type II secretion system protein n=1 Tax=Sinimarinibacterium sp. CAU 1509 TaxID=2562283 RepID=UPI0010AD11E3|nr:hypothetical protein [Sinimarinibacterium sp. CAU 1509]TJY57299.1 hypothetical protein E4T66_18000 [Sinimarinibacterium sp. CAU 1509]